VRTVGIVEILVGVLPLGAAGLSALGGKIARGATLVVAVACLLLSSALVPTVVATPSGVAVGLLRADALSLVFLLATAFLYASAAVFAIGYLAGEGRQRDFRRYDIRFYVGFNLFAWSMICATLANGLALLWIAVEITTVVSALMVALDRTRAASEAAWKYVLLASAGLGIALLATIIMYYAGSQVLGQSYDLAFAPLLAVAPHLSATAVRLAFVLAVVGFGTKVGLFPVHTWLPDAHSEAPTPVSAMLSGALLAVSFYAVLRYFQIARLSVGASFPRDVLLVFGMLSLLLAALSLFSQRDLKRLLAYSSVEHMGILALGVAFGAPLAAAGVLLHVLGHAAGKATAFYGAGAIVRSYHSKDLDDVRGVLDRLPWSGPALLAAILALSALPPFALFRSEFEIISGGATDSRYAPAAAMVGLVTLAFVGLAVATTRMMFSHPARPGVGDPRGVEAPVTGHTADLAGSRWGSGPGAARAPRATRATQPTRAEPSRWIVVAMLAGVLVLVVLGVHPPDALAALLAHGADQIAGSIG
jgi:hydrogenase-4 component F